MGQGVISQIGAWIAWPFNNQVDPFQLMLATLIIAIVVWVLADSTQWANFAEEVAQ